MADYSDTPELCANIEARMDAQACLMSADALLEGHPARPLVQKALMALTIQNRMDEAVRKQYLDASAGRRAA